MTIPIPSPTPNVVIPDPDIRRIVNVVFVIAAALLGTAIVVDGSSEAFDISAWTQPLSAGMLYLGTALGLTLTIPNIPAKAAKQTVLVVPDDSGITVDQERISGI